MVRPSGEICGSPTRFMLITSLIEKGDCAVIPKQRMERTRNANKMRLIKLVDERPMCSEQKTLSHSASQQCMTSLRWKHALFASLRLCGKQVLNFPQRRKDPEKTREVCAARPHIHIYLELSF